MLLAIYCENGELSTAYRLIWDPMDGGDDTGATGFSIRCESEDKSNSTWIGGYASQYYWYQKTNVFEWECPNEWYLDAIRVNSEPAQGGSWFTSSDDMALCNVQLWCNDPKSEEEATMEGPGHMPDDTSWSDKTVCPNYYGITGVRLRIEGGFDGDNTALNTISVYCDPIIDFMNATIDYRK